MASRLLGGLSTWAGLAPDEVGPDAAPRPIRWADAARAWLLFVPAYTVVFTALFGPGGAIGPPAAIAAIAVMLGRPGRPDARRHAKAALGTGFAVWLAAAFVSDALAHGHADWWTRAGVGAAIGTLALVVIVAVTHLPARSRPAPDEPAA
jgi:hypothetical protein